MGKNLKHYSDYLNERINKALLKRGRGDEDEELAPFTTSDGWDERQLGDLGLTDLFADIQKVIYEVKNARRGSYARFGDTPQDLGQHLIELGERLNAMGDEIMEESS